MDTQQKTIAQRCKDAAEDNTMTFPAIVGALIEAGFESYSVDFRRRTAIYYLPNDDSVEFKTHETANPVAAAFDDLRARAPLFAKRRTLRPATPTRASAPKPKRPGALATWSRSQASERSISAEPAKLTSSIFRDRGEDRRAAVSAAVRHHNRGDRRWE